MCIQLEKDRGNTIEVHRHLTRIVLSKSNDEKEDDVRWSLAICSRVFFTKSTVVSTILSIAAMSMSDDEDRRAARMTIVHKCEMKSSGSFSSVVLLIVHVKQREERREQEADDRTFYRIILSQEAILLSSSRVSIDWFTQEFHRRGDEKIHCALSMINDRFLDMFRLDSMKIWLFTHAVCMSTNAIYASIPTWVQYLCDNHHFLSNLTCQCGCRNGSARVVRLLNREE